MLPGLIAFYIQLLYKVGDVVRYVDFKLTGVVVGWDKVLKAPEEWIKIVSMLDNAIMTG
jgi:hemimethylated DNA binding protein